jgi:hypothetical protein
MLDQVTTNAPSNLAPIPMECDAPHLKITGELPRELGHAPSQRTQSVPRRRAHTGLSATARTPSIPRTPRRYRNRCPHAEMAGDTTLAARCSAASAASCGCPADHDQDARREHQHTFTAAACWRWKKAICRLKSSLIPSTASAIATTSAHRNLHGASEDRSHDRRGVFFGYNAAGPLTSPSPSDRSMRPAS